MGANSSGLVNSGLLSYLKMILLSAGLAFPAGLILLRRWLQDFEFHRNIDPVIFIFTLLIIFIVVFTTVVSQILRSASINPVDSLRHE
jgi:putative ABC transport system permease protein